MVVLVTGGAGFIGSHLVDALLALGDEVRVLDDLSTGYRENVPAGASLVEAPVTDLDALAGAMRGVEVVHHLAAARAVARSVDDPLTTDTANVHGTLAVLRAAHAAGVRRVVNASSSSVYGGAVERPTPESAPLVPRSPYAVSKLAGEHYCRVFSELHGLETVSLRYFNVYGPRQRPDSAYATVIPLFADALRAGRSPEVHGDGRQTRDFTYVDDVVRANLAAAAAPADEVRGRAFNVATGAELSLLDLLDELRAIVGSAAAPVTHVAPRAGDVRHSWADVSAALAAMDWKAEVGAAEGLRRTVAWLSSRSTTG